MQPCYKANVSDTSWQKVNNVCAKDNASNSSHLGFSGQGHCSSSNDKFISMNTMRCKGMKTQWDKIFSHLLCLKLNNTVDIYLIKCETFKESESQPWTYLKTICSESWDLKEKKLWTVHMYADKYSTKPFHGEYFSSNHTYSVSHLGLTVKSMLMSSESALSTKHVPCIEQSYSQVWKLQTDVLTDLIQYTPNHKGDGA